MQGHGLPPYCLMVVLTTAADGPVTAGRVPGEPCSAWRLAAYHLPIQACSGSLAACSSAMGLCQQTAGAQSLPPAIRHAALLSKDDLNKT